MGLERAERLGYGGGLQGEVSQESGRKSQTLFLILVLAFLAGQMFDAQAVTGAPCAAADSATIKGVVRDESGAVVSGAKVTLRNESTSVSQSTVSAHDGTYIFTPVGIGTYRLEVEVLGFKKESRPRIALDRAQELVVDFSLVPGQAPQNGQPIPTPPPGRIGSASPSEPDRSKNVGEHDNFFRRFDYYDKPELKPGQIQDSAYAGGYSASAYPDSYGLVLAYVQNEGPPEGRFEDQRQMLSHSTKGPNPRDPGADGKAGNPGEAAKSPKQFDGVPPRDSSESQFLARGSDLLLHREFGPAIEVLNRGVERYPNSTELQIGLGIALYGRGHYDDAVKALLRATDLVPTDPRPYRFLAKAYNVSNRQAEEVTKRLQRFVQLEPQQAVAHYYYALSLWKGKGNRVVS